jgi:hypothetical protein
MERWRAQCRRSWWRGRPISAVEIPPLQQIKDKVTDGDIARDEEYHAAHLLPIACGIDYDDC